MILTGNTRWRNDTERQHPLAEWYWQATPVGRMILTGNTRSTVSTTCLSATWLTINLRSTGLWLNHSLRFEKPGTYRLGHRTSEFSQVRGNNRDRSYGSSIGGQQSACRGWRALVSRATKLGLQLMQSVDQSVSPRVSVSPHAPPHNLRAIWKVTLAAIACTSAISVGSAPKLQAFLSALSWQPLKYRVQYLKGAVGQ
jgi:hypothetical protein